MTSLTQLLGLSGADLPTVLAVTGADLSARVHAFGYQGLADADIVEFDGGRLALSGDEVLLVQVNAAYWFPEGLTNQDLVVAVGGPGQRLRGRGGKLAKLHVAAEHGVAWEEVQGEVRYLEFFPPSDVATYERTVYAEPPRFVE